MTINDRREVGKVLEKECEMWEWEQDRGGNFALKMYFIRAGKLQLALVKSSKR